MGLVPLTGQAKVFEGAPINTTNFADINSIQGAIKGTLDNPSSANTKNFATLNSLAKLDMFVPKRTGLATSAVDYRGFPRPTATMNINYFEYDTTSGALDLLVNFNNKVGYSIQVTVRVTVTSIINSNNQQSMTLTFAAGATSRIYNFEFNSSSWGASEPYTIEILTSSPAVYQPINLTGTKTRLTGGGGGAGTPYNVQASAFGFSCHTPTGSFTTHWINGPLATGSTVTTASATPPSADTYIEQNGNFIYTTNSAGTITAFEFCVID